MAINAFREAYMSADILDSADFSAFGARQLRYRIYWSFYENTAYRNIHKWATSYRNQHGLYKYIRNIFNPTYRLGEFWKAMTWGGMLDDEAGMTGAIPIQTNNEALRPVIARLWRESNWNVNKDIMTLQGSILGDVGIKIVDDAQRGLVRLEVIHPGMIRDVQVDPAGYVKGYELEEETTGPDGRKHTYTEIASRDGDLVVYQTLIDGRPGAWQTDAAGDLVDTWSVPYTFTPFVILQHNNVGLEWGWSEIHPLRSKIHESDDLASKIHDQIRKMVDAPFLFAGVKKPSTQPETSGATPTQSRPEPGREEIPAIYSTDPAASATPLVAPLDLAASTQELQQVLSEIERDYPELQMDIWSAQNTSGRALRTARQRAEIKVKQRRGAYDSAIERAHQMAIAIGGWRGYPGYEGFGLESFDRGALDHSVADRPVFSRDPMDDIEQAAAFWDAAGRAINAGVALEAYLAEMGWDEERIRRAVFGDNIPPTSQ